MEAQESFCVKPCNQGMEVITCNEEIRGRFHADHRTLSASIQLYSKTINYVLERFEGNIDNNARKWPITQVLTYPPSEVSTNSRKICHKYVMYY